MKFVASISVALVSISAYAKDFRLDNSSRDPVYVATSTHLEYCRTSDPYSGSCLEWVDGWFVNGWNEVMPGESYIREHDTKTCLAVLSGDFTDMIAKMRESGLVDEDAVGGFSAHSDHFSFVDKYVDDEHGSILDLRIDGEPVSFEEGGLSWDDIDGRMESLGFFSVEALCSDADYEQLTINAVR